MTKSVPFLTIDTKSRSKKKTKRKSGFNRAQEHVKEQDKLSNQNDAPPEVQTGIAHQDIPAEQQLAIDVEQPSAPALSSSATSPDLSSPHPTSPFDTARTHLSPPLSHPPSTPCSFATAAANDTPNANANDAGELEDAGAEITQPGEDSVPLRLTPSVGEVEEVCAWPVSDSQGYLSGK